MENGEWRIGNGEWGMENGEWRIGNGEWRMDAIMSFPPVCRPVILAVQHVTLYVGL